jgi:hypothetical protein
LYNVGAVVQYFAVTAAGSRLLKIIIENFAGYGFQKSEDFFEIKKLFSWCDVFVDFYVSNKIQHDP